MNNYLKKYLLHPSWICRKLVVLMALATIHLVTVLPASAQLVNGSFESGEDASLKGWEYPCGSDSVEAAPPEGGRWALRMFSGSTQGCFPGIAEQVIPVIRNGEVWKAQAWARQQPLTQHRGMASLYWEVLKTDGTSTMVPPIPPYADTTSALDWTLLTVVDTLMLAEGEQAVLVLDAGLQGGPIITRTDFDLISIEKVTEVATRVDDPRSGFNEIRIQSVYPNPVRGWATIRLEIGHSTEVTLKVYNVLGQEVATPLSKNLPAGFHEIPWTLGKLPGGLYLLRLEAGSHVEVRSVLVF